MALTAINACGTPARKEKREKVLKLDLAQDSLC